jgi:NTE family protein
MAHEAQGLFRLLRQQSLGDLPRERIDRGATLISQGSTADAMYLVETGRFRVERDGIVLAEISAGSFIGEIAFFTGETRTADVIAARDAVVIRIDAAAFDALCAAHPGLNRAIIEQLSGRLASTSARVVPDPGRPPARTFCALSAGGAPLPAGFVPALAREIGRYHDIAVITEDDFETTLGKDADPTSDAAIAWLNDQERAAEVVIFVAGHEASDWARAAVRQADQGLFVAQAVRFAEPSALERFALDTLTEDQRRLVLIHPHRQSRVSGSAPWLDSRMPFLHHHVALTEDGADIARLGRFLAGRAIGMVMSGGGAFGVAHIGIWRAMTEAGLPLDIVGGTSVGAAMAGAIALGVPEHEIGPRVEQIFVTSGAMKRITVPKYAFLDHTVFDANLEHHYTTTPVEDLWLPFFAVSADLSTMRKRVIRRGPLWEAVRASAAIPGVLPAFYTSDGSMLVDGGCIDNMPFRDMHGLKTGPNIVVNVQRASATKYNVDYQSLPGRAELLRKTLLPFGKRPPRAPGVISTVMRSLMVGQAETAGAMNPDDLHIRPPGLKGAGFLAWDQHKLFYEMAYKHGRDKIFADLGTSDNPAKIALRRAAGLGS